jgi:signal transduction histidine kinase
MAPLRSLKFRIALTIFLLEGIMMAVVLAQVLGQWSRSAEEQLAAQENVMLNILGRVARTALITDEFNELQFYLAEAERDPHLARAWLTDGGERIVASATRADLGQSLAAIPLGRDQRRRTVDVANATGLLGRLVLEFSNHELLAARARARDLGVAVAAVGMSLIAVVGLLIGHLLTRRLARLELGARSMAAGDMQVRTQIGGGDEVAALSASFDAMAESLARERKALKQTNRELDGLVAARTAQLTQINHELESFAYSVSHDLRGPLRGIDGFSKALLDDYGARLDDEGRDYLARVRGSAQRMAQMIDDLLKLSRVTRVAISRTDVDLSVVAQEVVAALRREDPTRLVAVDIAPAMRTQADPGLMRNLLENLLHNAWKYSAKTAQARIEVGHVLRDEETVYFVRDNGAGFDMRYIDKLFGAFQRLHRVDEFEGTGIGLATARRIVARHSGRIWAEGEPGKGATFYFTLGVAAPSSGDGGRS